MVEEGAANEFLQQGFVMIQEEVGAYASSIQQGLENRRNARGFCAPLKVAPRFPENIDQEPASCQFLESKPFQGLRLGK
jgi:hypothetical protein